MPERTFVKDFFEILRKIFESSRKLWAQYAGSSPAKPQAAGRFHGKDDTPFFCVSDAVFKDHRAGRRLEGQVFEQIFGSSRTPLAVDGCF